MKLNLFDGHLHTDCSFDGLDSITHLCERAVELGVMGITVADHYDCDSVDFYNSDLRIRESFFETNLAQAQFTDNLKIYCGIELGQGHLFPEAAERVLSRYSFDVVLGAMHVNRDMTNFRDLNYAGNRISIRDLIERYLDDLIAMTDWGGFDVLAHLHYPEWFIWGKYKIPVRITDYADRLDRLLRLLAEKGKALELNTRCLQKGQGRAYLVPEVLRRFRALGGEHVTLGSDAHDADGIAFGFSEAMDLLEELGYGYFTFYKQRRPVMLKII